MKKFKILTLILLTFTFFLFTFQTFAAEEEEPKVSIQIKNEVDAYVQKGTLQPFHQSLYDLEGYQTVYWKFVKINQNFDSFKSLTEDQIRSFIHSYRSKTDETWNYLFKNLDIEPQYLEQGQIVGLYWDSFVEDSKDGYLYLIWTSMYSPSEFMNLLEIKESKKTYKLYDTKQDEEELNMNWYDSDFYNFRMWNLTLHLTPIAGYINQEHFGLPLKQKYSFEGFTAGLDDAQYGYEIDKERHFDLTSTHKMEFDLGLTPKQDGKNSMQLVTHGYEIIKECEVQSHFDLNFGGYMHYTMFNTTIPIDKIYRVDVSYKITNDNKSWWQFFLPTDEHQIKKSLTCERVKAGIFGLSTYQGFQEGSYQSTLSSSTNYKYRLHLNYDDAWNLFEGQEFYETDYKRVSEFQILRMNYLVDGKTYDVPVKMDTVEGDTLFALDPDLILDTQTPYYTVKKGIDDFFRNIKGQIQDKMWIIWTILGVVGFIILVAIIVKIKNFIRFIFPKKRKTKGIKERTNMKHKILFSILSILGIASILGLSFLPKEEISVPTPQRLSLSSTTPSQSIVTKEDIPLQDWIKTAQVGNTISFDHFVYTREAARVSVTCTEPEVVETLYLYFNLQRNDTAFIPVSHYNIDFSQLINVKKVVIFNNDPFYCFGSDLKKLPNSFDLYINGYFNSLEEYPNIKELYICEVYDTDTSDIDSYSDSHKLASTHITKVHYANWNQPWTSANRFSNEEIENADGVLVQVDFLPEETIGFSEALFYPHENYIPQKKLLGTIAYPYYQGRLTKIFPENIEYKIDKISSQVKTFILPSDINFTNYGTFNVDTLVIDNANFNFTSLLNSTIDTLVFRNHTEDFSFNQIIKAKNIWFAPLETPPTITSSSYNENNNAQIEHIYIPNEYKEAYDKFSSEFFQSRITYYDVADLEEYHTSFESTNGNIYYAEDDTKDIDTLESYITEMTEENFTFTTTEALDTQYQIFLQNKTEEPDEPTPSTPTDFVDESEFIKGYQALGSIYYTSNKSLEDILKIASNYILQKDGVRCDEEKEVSFLVNGNTLNTTIKVNGKIVASVSSNLHKLDTKEFGEFIYLQNVGAFYGELLYDTTSTTTKTPQEIYSYLLHQVTTTKEVATPDFKDFSLTSPSSVDISSSLIHTNGNKYRVNMECLSFDLSQAKDLSNPEITFQQVMSPDDEKEDPESEYAVKTITKIYLPNTLNARGVPSSINSSILTYKGTPYIEKECIHTITSSNKNDGKDYTITMAGSLPDSIWYEHTVPVSILADTYNVAFAVCEDNTIIVILPYSKKLSKEILSSNLEDFITKELKITESNLKLVEEMDLNLTKTFTGSTYKNGKIDIVVSGLSTLLNSSLTTPVDQSKEKEGFTALTHFIFSNDISVERAAKLVADKILYFNGYPVDTPYKTNITLYPNSIGFEFIKEDKVVLRITSTYKVIKNAPYSFVSASSSYHTGIILTSPKDVMVTTFMNEVMPYIQITFEADYSSTVSLATKGNTKLEGIYKLADSNYYEYTYTIMALDIEAKENQVDVEIIYKDKVEEDKKDKPIDNIFNDFKDNFENNTAFKTMSIILGTILGLALIYVIYLIIHKIHKWLKK